MSKRIHNQDAKARLPLFLFLLGTAAFSLSALPNVKDDGHFMVTSLSSEFASDCQSAVNRIGSGDANNGSCHFNAVKSDSDTTLTGSSRFDLVTVSKRDPNDFDNKVTSVEWKRVTKIICKGKFCPGGDQDEIVIDDNDDNPKKNDYRSLTSKVMSDFKKGAAEMAARIKEAKRVAELERAKKEKRERCETDSKDRKIEGKERMNCRVGRLDNMDDEQAADYYEKYILPEVESMVASSDVRKQRAGMALLKQLNTAGVGGDFVKESVADLARFGQFKYQSDQQKVQILAMNQNDPRRQPMIEQMRQSQFQADMYFRSRGLQIENQDWGVGGGFGFDFGTVLTDNLTNFQNRLDQNYAALLQQQQYLLNANGFQQRPGQTQVSNPNLVNNPAAQQQQQPQQPFPQGAFNQNGAPPPPPQAATQNSQMTPQQWAALTPAQKQAAQVNGQSTGFAPALNNSPAPSTSLQASPANVVIPRSVSKR